MTAFDRLTQRFLTSLTCLLVLYGSTTRPAHLHAQDLSQPELSPANGMGRTDIAREPLGEVRLLARPNSSPFVTLRVVFEAGSAEDPPGREGVTALAGSLMLEGGAGALSYAQIAEQLFPMAAELSVHTSREQTTFVGRVHRDHLAAFYPLFRSTLLEPRLAESDFERLRHSALNRIQHDLRGNDEEQLGKETLMAMVFEGHPYGHLSTGRVDALQGLSLEDVATQRAHLFCGRRATVGVTGGYPEGFAEQLRDDVASLESEECLGRGLLPDVQLDGPRIWLVQKDDATSVAISMGMPIGLVRGDPDYPALVLAGAYLGQHRTFAGRLMTRMRSDRGLNYGNYAYIEHFEQDPGTAFPRPNIAQRQQIFSIWIRPVTLEQAHFALRMAVRELREFAEHGLNHEDFERIRAYVMGYYALYQQTASRQLGFALDDLFYGQDQPWYAWLESRWTELTVEEVNQAIRRQVDPSVLQIVVVHPDAAAFAERLASDAPSPITYLATPSAEVVAEDLEIAPYPIGVGRERMTIIPVETLFQ